MVRLANQPFIATHYSKPFLELLTAFFKLGPFYTLVHYLHNKLDWPFRLPKRLASHTVAI